MSVILVDRLATADGRTLVELKPNVAKTSNALNAEMIDLLLQGLQDCRDDPSQAAVVLDCTGEKAFLHGWRYGGPAQVLPSGLHTKGSYGVY